MARIPYVTPETAGDPNVAQALERSPQLNIFRLLAHAETGFRPWLRYGAALLSELELDPVQRELAILRVARLEGAEYEWIQHVGIALAVGATQAQVDAVDHGEIDAGCLDAAQQAVLALTTETVREVRVADATFAAAMEHLDPRRLVELLLVVGQYMTVARVMEVCRIDLDEPLGEQVLESAEVRLRRFRDAGAGGSDSSAG